MVDCSEKLRALREARGLTQLRVAQRVGVSKTMVSAYETASKAPSIEVLIRLSRLFGVSVDYLVCVDAPKAAAFFAEGSLGGALVRVVGVVFFEDLAGAALLTCGALLRGAGEDHPAAAVAALGT